jgi:hypothetical protein
MTTKVKITNKAPQAHHYFGSTAFNWATGDTRAEVLAKLGRMTGPNELKLQVKAHGGLYVWTCRVNVPEATQYDIESYAPKGVETAAPAEARLVNTKGHVIPND